MENFHHNSNLADKIHEYMRNEILMPPQSYKSGLMESPKEAIWKYAALAAFGTSVIGGVDYAVAREVGNTLANGTFDITLSGGVICGLALVSAFMAGLAAKCITKVYNNLTYYRHWQNRKASENDISSEDISTIVNMKKNRW